jgi:hypothetical protein
MRLPESISGILSLNCQPVCNSGSIPDIRHAAAIMAAKIIPAQLALA